MDGTKNLTVARGEKSVWDKPSLSSSLSCDQERWLMAAWGSALVMGGSQRGGFGGVARHARKRSSRCARRWAGTTFTSRGDGSTRS